MKKRLTLITFVFLSLIILLLGCGNQQNNPQVPDKNQISQKKSIPESKIEDTGLELNIKPMDSPSEIVIPEVFIENYPLPESEALSFTERMKIGWNLGNTFDAHTDSSTLEDDLLTESMWCGIKTTKEMITTVKDAGFKTIRIPVSWHNHISGDKFIINQSWMDRVKEVVDYAIEEDMYVILNIHHDISEEYYYPSVQYLHSSIAYVSSIWSQIANKFKDYDEHLIFEAVNEPRLVGTKFEWWLNMNDQRCIEAVECINKLNQAFVDTVRSTGENNRTRYLMVPGYCAAADYALLDAFELPQDTVEDRIIVSVHAYTPYRFALQSPGEQGSVSAWSLSDPSSTHDIDAFMTGLYEKYIRQGIPVVIGEFGARDKGGNLQDRVEYAAYYIRSARARGMTCLWWDNNAFSGNGENFGLLDRQNLKWVGQDIVDAMMKYAEAEK